MKCDTLKLTYVEKGYRCLKTQMQERLVYYVTAETSMRLVACWGVYCQSVL